MALIPIIATRRVAGYPPPYIYFSLNANFPGGNPTTVIYMGKQYLYDGKVCADLNPCIDKQKALYHRFRLRHAPSSSLVFNSSYRPSFNSSGQIVYGGILGNALNK